MLAARTIRCKVFAIDARNNVTEVSEGDAPKYANSPAPRFRPSDLVPWADPYIAGLVHRLQSDVRKELAQAARTRAARFAAPVGDLEWPWDDGVADMETVETEEPTSSDGLNWDQRF
jgi:hypothetical protein